MTEKEFLSRAYSDDRLNLLTLAKEAGAKFDPEPVTLPQLKVRQIISILPYVYSIEIHIPQPVPSGMTYYSTKEQSEEIIRRCKVVDKLRAYAKSHLERTGSYVDSNFLRILNS